jgi:translation initiation factor 2 gamma subunit (eIF-2gamma)
MIDAHPFSIKITTELHIIGEESKGSTVVVVAISKIWDDKHEEEVRGVVDNMLVEKLAQ